MSNISFTSSAPGYWANEDIPYEDWNSAKWQLKNRVSSLADIEKHLKLCEEERAGILLTGTKLATNNTTTATATIPPLPRNATLQIRRLGRHHASG